jgi:nicotinate-nucleotide adenylyltransferase
VIRERPFRRLLYGGTYDPVHAAHVAVAEAAGRLLGADVVSLVPAGDPPHKSDGPYASARHRLEMVRRAVAGRPLLDVLDVEVRRGGTSYTIDTIESLLAGPCEGESLLLLLGQDALDLLPQWHRAQDLVRLVPIVVAPRSDTPEPPWERLGEAFGTEVVESLRSRVLATPREPISSTQVRERIAAGKSIRCWVPDPVADYIEEHRLYVPAEPEGG